MKNTLRLTKNSPSSWPARQVTTPAALGARIRRVEVSNEEDEEDDDEGEGDPSQNPRDEAMSFCLVDHGKEKY